MAQFEGNVKKGVAELARNLHDLQLQQPTAPDDDEYEEIPYVEIEVTGETSGEATDDALEAESENDEGGGDGTPDKVSEGQGSLEQLRLPDKEEFKWFIGLLFGIFAGAVLVLAISLTALGVTGASLKKVSNEKGCHNPCALTTERLKNNESFEWTVTLEQTDNDGCLLLLAAQCAPQKNSSKSLPSELLKPSGPAAVHAVNGKDGSKTVVQLGKAQTSSAQVHLMLLCSGNSVESTNLADGTVAMCKKGFDFWCTASLA